MIGAEGLPTDRQRALKERLRLGVAALIVIKLAEVIEARSNQLMFGAEGFLLDLQRTLVERLRLGVTAGRLCKHSPATRA